MVAEGALVPIVVKGQCQLQKASGDHVEIVVVLLLPMACGTR